MLDQKNPIESSSRMSGSGGRPHSPARQALLHALHSGASGTWEALARHAGVDPHKARRILDNMRRHGAVVAQPPPAGTARPTVGRPRAIYAPVAPPQFDSLSYACQVWR
jgi:predicted ArsR family transcriptional regulator